MNISLNAIPWQKEHRMNAGARALLELDCPMCVEQNADLVVRLFPESYSKKIGGDIQESLQELEVEVVARGENTATFITPDKPGAYRVFVFAQNDHRQVSVANVPFFVE